ncbi:hypothetical protein KIL84_017020, partial [Mauremys mutica]
IFAWQYRTRKHRSRMSLPLAAVHRDRAPGIQRKRIPPPILQKPSCPVNDSHFQCSSYNDSGPDPEKCRAPVTHTDVGGSNPKDLTWFSLGGLTHAKAPVISMGFELIKNSSSSWDP